MPEVFIDEKRFVRSQIGLFQVPVQLLLVGQNFHPPSAQNVRRAYENRETDVVNRLSQIIGRCAGGTSWHSEPAASSKRFESLSVAGLINGIAGCSHDGQIQAACGKIR